MRRLSALELFLYLTFIYLHKAYDSAPLSKLWPVMQQTRVRVAFITAVGNFYKKCVSAVKVRKRCPKSIQ